MQGSGWKQWIVAGIVVVFIWTAYQWSQPEPKSETQLYKEELLETARVRQKLLRSMQEVVDRAAAHNENATVRQARSQLAFFREHFNSVALQMRPGPDGSTDILVRAVLEECATKPCYHFARKENPMVFFGASAGSWVRKARLMLVSPSLETDDVLAPMILFHELYHAQDIKHDAAVLAGSWDPDRQAMPWSEDQPVPWETEAYDYESRLLDASTGGAYMRAVSQLAEDVSSGRASVRPRMVTFTSIPEDVFVSVKGEHGYLPQGSRSLLRVQTTYELNKLLYASMPEGEERDRAIAGLYANIIIESTNDDRANDYLTSGF